MQPPTIVLCESSEFTLKLNVLPSKSSDLKILNLVPSEIILLVIVGAGKWATAKLGPCPVILR